jgi:hypothetical protein
MVLPYPVLIKTQIPAKKKLVLFGLFSLGAFITIIQIIRIQTIHNLANYLDSSMLIMWSMVENNLGIIVASVPPLSPLIRSWREKSSKNSNGRSGASYALGSMKDGRLRLGSQNDYGLRGGDDYKVKSHTTVKTGSFRNGDNSSEEYIVDGGYGHDRIRATTEVRIETEYEDGRSGDGSKATSFTDQRRPQDVAHAV